MEMVLTAAYELAACFAPMLVAFALMRARARSTGRLAAGLAPVLLFSLYLFAVLSVTGAGTVFDLARRGLEANGQVNLVPLASLIGSADALEGFALNVVLFLPLGFLLPFIWPRSWRALPVTVFGLGFSLVIELSQLLNNRSTDVDDLLANALGALLGFAAYALWRDAAGRVAIVRRKNESARPAPAPSPVAFGGAGAPRAHAAPVFSLGIPRPWSALREPAWYAAVLFAGRFLLFDEFGLVRLLFGF